MATITPSTFDPLLGFVNVRLQQGVPIVDADWNELDEIRKFELRAFLKWYVGDGVPDGNDGFRIDGGLDNDFTIKAGGSAPPSGSSPMDIALRHVGRCVVDGLDVIIPADVQYTKQALHVSQPGSAQLATRLGVPVIPVFGETSNGAYTVYLDVWERLLTPDERPELVHPGLGVETCARIRREWVVRVRPGDAVPKRGETDFLPGHVYLALAAVTRRTGVKTITQQEIRDLRQSRLLVPPANLITDTLGIPATAYRRGEQRPPVSLREAINALLAGRLPSTDDIPVSPSSGIDLHRRSMVRDSTGGVVVVWQSPRAASVNQIFAARLDPAKPGDGFSAPPIQVTTGIAHQDPTVVALPGGDLVVAYQDGPAGAATTNVVMKRGPLLTLAGQPETTIASTATADTSPFAVLSGNHIVFFTFETVTNKWNMLVYNHTNPNPPSTPVALNFPTGGVRDLHASAVDTGQVWVALADNANVRILRVTPSSGTVDSIGSIPAAAGNLSVFVVGIDANSAVVFYDDAQSLKYVTVAAATAGSPIVIPGTVGADGQPAAVLEGRNVLLFSMLSADILLRRLNLATGEWGQVQKVVAVPIVEDTSPFPLQVDGQGTWLIWQRDVGAGDSDLFVKRFITTI